MLRGKGAIIVCILSHINMYQVLLTGRYVTLSAEIRCCCFLNSQVIISGKTDTSAEDFKSILILFPF